MVGLIGEIRAQHEDLYLMSTMAKFPKVRFTLVSHARVGDGRPIAIFRVDSPESVPHEEVLATLKDDVTVLSVEEMAREPTAFYRMTLYNEIFVKSGKKTFHDIAMDVGVVVKDVNAYGGSWNITVETAGRKPFTRLLECLREIGITCITEKLCEMESVAHQHSLTETQLETLKVAFEKGYFDDPRGISQSELAVELGISKSVLSRRLRKILKRVIQQTLNFS